MFCMKKNSWTLLVKLALLFIQASLLASSVRALCGDSRKLPLHLQTDGDEEDIQAEAIAASDDLNAIFIGGGELKNKDWKLASGEGTAFVGRVNMDQRMFVWGVQIAETTNNLLKSVTALAVESGTTPNLACYGYAAKLDELDQAQGYLFLLDANSGKSTSKMLELTHSSAY